MRRFFRPGRYANVASTLALIVALGGTSYAAIKLPRNTVASKHIKPGAVKNSDIRSNAVTSSKVRDGSLLAADLAPGQLPAGPTGATGPKGDRGDTGPAGSPDTPEQVRDKLAGVDGAGSGVDADVLDGVSSDGFVQGAGRLSRGTAFRLGSDSNVPVIAAGDFTVRMDCDVASFVRLDLINNGSNATVWMDDGVTQASTILVQNEVLESRNETATRSAGRGLLVTWQGVDSTGRSILIHTSAYRDEFGPSTRFCQATAVASVLE